MSTVQTAYLTVIPFLLEGHVQLKFPHLQIDEITARLILHSEESLQPHQAYKGTFQIAVAGPRTEARASESRGVHHAEGDVPMNRPEAQNIQAGEPGEAARVMPLPSVRTLAA